MWKMEKKISKIFAWMLSFDHKKALVEISGKSMKIWWSYSSFKNFNQRVNQMLTPADDRIYDRYVSPSVTFVAGETKIPKFGIRF